MGYEVTIGIPVYNAERYLEGTMQAALSQDFTSIEYLVLDDCGTDSSMSIIRHLQQEHHRGCDIHVVRQPHNMGIGCARNRLVDEAQGRYLYFLDADDLIRPDTISRLYQAAVSHDADAVWGSYELIREHDETSERREYAYPYTVYTQPDELATSAFSHYVSLQAQVWNILMRVDLVRQSGLRFIDTNYWEDLTFNISWVTYVKRAVLLPDITYSYYCRANTLSNFQEREHISKAELLRNVATVRSLLPSYQRLLAKPYFADWLNTLLKTLFFVMCWSLKNRQRISPAVTDRELADFLQTPLSLRQTLRYCRMREFVSWMVCKLPPGILVGLVKIVGKKKGLV